MEERAKRAVQGNMSRGNRGRGNRGGRGGYSNPPRHQANAAQVIEAVPEPDLTAEYAGNASLISPDSPASADTHWVADTGASCHMTSHREWLTGFSESLVTVELADGSVIYGTGRGTISFIPYINGCATEPIVLQNVLHVPSLHNNLFSIFHFTMNTQATAEVNRTQMSFRRNGTIVLTATQGTRNVALLDGHTVSPVKAFLSMGVSGATLAQWHTRFNHSHYGAIQKLEKSDAVLDFKLLPGPPAPSICEECVEGKQHRAPHTQPATRTTEPLERIHSDVHGQLPVMTRHGYHYWVVFVDDYSRLAAAYFLKTKDETFEAFKRFKAWAENKLNRKIKALRDDKGGEYMSAEFNNFCETQGIECEHTIRDTPQQNGVAERLNRTLAEGITTMLIQAKLPPSMWADAAGTFIHTHNRLPSPNTGNQTPYELFHGKRPSVSHLRTWGCLARVHLQKDQRQQLAPHTRKCIFIGYPHTYKGWVFWDPETRKEVISDSAVFDEDTFPGSIRNPINAPANTNPITIDLFLPPALQIRPTANNPMPPAPPLPAILPAARQDDPAPPDPNEPQEPAPGPPNPAPPRLLLRLPGRLGQGGAVQLAPDGNEHQPRRIRNELHQPNGTSLHRTT
jgi:transposase InsO family protein